MSARRLLGWLHLWTGLILCLPLVMLGVTGSVLVFGDELAEWLDPQLYRASPGEPRPIAAIIAAARAAAPAELRPGFYIAPEKSGDAARVRFMPASRQAPGPGGSIVFMDAATATPLGVRENSAGLVRQIFLLHASLLSDRTGRDVVGWLGVVMLALGLSGIVLWWPRGGRWAAAFRVRRGAQGVRLHRDLHGAVGIWGLLVFLVVSFSGVYLAFPQQVGAGIGSVLPARDLRGTMNAIKATPIKDAKPIGVDAAVQIAREALPDTRLRSVALPQRPDQPFRVALARLDDAHGVPPVLVFVDPWSSKVLELRDPRGYSAGETLMAWQHALHAGEGLGWIWRVLVFLSGLLPLLFSITGVSMWWLKRRARGVAVAAREAPAE